MRHHERSARDPERAFRSILSAMGRDAWRLICTCKNCTWPVAGSSASNPCSLREDVGEAVSEIVGETVGDNSYTLGDREEVGEEVGEMVGESVDEIVAMGSMIATDDAKTILDRCPPCRSIRILL